MNRYKMNSSGKGHMFDFDELCSQHGMYWEMDTNKDPMWNVEGPKVKILENPMTKVTVRIYDKKTRELLNERYDSHTDIELTKDSHIYYRFILKTVHEAIGFQRSEKLKKLLE